MQNARSYGHRFENLEISDDEEPLRVIKLSHTDSHTRAPRISRGSDLGGDSDRNYDGSSDNCLDDDENGRGCWCIPVLFTLFLVSNRSERNINQTFYLK